MLLFNLIAILVSCLYFDFNTSNVTIQQVAFYLIFSYSFISIHLMLLFNKIRLWLHTYISRISIHLMLLFNEKILSESTMQNYFNTSNVTIQPTGHLLIVSLISISIHLMLLFNRICRICHSCCYIISIHLMLLFNKHLCQ